MPVDLLAHIDSVAEAESRSRAQVIILRLELLCQKKPLLNSSPTPGPDLPKSLPMVEPKSHAHSANSRAAKGLITSAVSDVASTGAPVSLSTWTQACTVTRCGGTVIERDGKKICQRCRKEY